MSLWKGVNRLWVVKYPPDVLADRSEPFVSWEGEQPSDLLADKSEPCVG